MEETIIIYTKFYSEAVIQVIETYDLNVQLMCFSTYDQILQYVETTPNIRGIIFLEHKPGKGTFKAYNTILTTADEIAESSGQPLCVSIISNNDMPKKFLSQIKTEYIDVLFTKFLMFNTDLLRFEGIAAVIMKTIGVANETILMELEHDEDSMHLGNKNSKVDFLTQCLEITTVDKKELDNFVDATERFPELEKLISLRSHGDLDQSVTSNSQSLFKVFAEQCIERRKQDEA